MSEESDIRNLIEFLRNHVDCRKLELFANMCLRMARGYLAFIVGRGKMVPRKSDNLQKDILDLAVDIVSRYLWPQDNRPAHMLFKYLDNLGYTSFDFTAGGEIYGIFKRQLLGFVKQEMPKINYDADPLVAKFARQVERALSSKDYSTAKLKDNSTVYIYLACNANALRINRPEIDYYELAILAEKAIQQSKTVPQILRNIFERLNKSQEFANFIPVRELKKVIIETYLRFIDIDPVIPIPAGPKDDFALKKYLLAKDCTVMFMRRIHLQHFIDKEKINNKQADLLSNALAEYFDDIITKGDYDSLPSYCQRVFPEIDSKEYQKRYKHIWDTTVRSAMNYFMDKINNDPTLGSIGS
jgi:hypothetical protein